MANDRERIEGLERAVKELRDRVTSLEGAAFLSRSRWPAYVGPGWSHALATSAYSSYMADYERIDVSEVVLLLADHLKLDVTVQPATTAHVVLEPRRKS